MTNNIEKYRKQSDFTAPEGYYGELYEKMMKKVAKSERTNLFTRRTFLYSVIGGAIAAAIALLVVFNLSIFTTHDPQPQPTPLLVAEENREISDLPPATTTNTTTIIEEEENSQILMAANKTSSPKVRSSVAKSDKNQQISDNTEAPIQLDDLSYSVIEFYNDAALDNLFQETMMDLECYVDF